MESLSHPAANHHVNRVLLGTHLPGHGITERSEQQPDSQASLWEMAIKDNDNVQAEGFEWLAISNEHLLEIARLETIEGHRDPFDRCLVAQSRVEPLLLFTCDRALQAYGTCVRLIS